MTATQPCTAMVWHFRYPGSGPRKHCGEPVAELCGAPMVSGEVCNRERDAEVSQPVADGFLGGKNGPGAVHKIFHTYQGRLVHVTLGPCVDCGSEGFDHPHGGCEVYAPTVTELDVEHSAEVSDGN